MFSKVKQFFTLLGIFGAIAFMYITKKKLEIKSLKKLLQKDYKAKLGKLDEQRKDLKSKLKADKSGKVSKIKKEIKELDKSRRKIKADVKKMDTRDVSSAVDQWFKSR
tara:strand:+ start:220 stop:543 length:324 start_codon:yes stop_codon:yes gene_type:complete